MANCNNRSKNHTILIPEDVVIVSENGDLPLGSYIGVFYNNQYGDLVCGGYTQWNGEDTLIPAWGDDEETDDKDGFDIGEEFIWAIWNNQTGVTSFGNVEYNNSGAFQNEGLYAINGMSGIINLVAPAPIWNFSVTDVNHTIALSELDIYIGDEALEYGDWLAVFYTDDNGELACGGMTMWTGNNTNMAAMGDDSQTTIKDGFAIGEEFIWKIWNYSNGEEFSTSANYLTSFNGFDVPNSGFYENYGLSAVGSFSTDINHTIQINEGWSIISTYINPVNPDMANLMSPIVDDNNLLIIKNGVGAVYWPSFSLNTIGDINIGEGYQIKVNNVDNLTFSGELIPHDFNMQLNEGWSIISYLHQEPFNTVDMMSSIVENIDIIKNGVGAVYWPDFDLNTIGDMIPEKVTKLK